MTVSQTRTRSSSGARESIEGRAERRSYRRLIPILAGAGAFCIIVVSLAAVYLAALPGVGDAEGRVAEIVRSHHGELSGPALPAKLAAAVVAVEDKYFYSNVFVNVFYGVARAAFASLRGSGDPGGSTIEQQLAKQLYPHAAGLAGTLQELGLGIKLSLVYSKEQILNMYLNVVSYGHGYRGDVAAARGYFGVEPGRLTWAQATLLAGLPQAPSLYDPFHHFRLAKERQSRVIDQLADNRYLSDVEAAAIYREPLGLKNGARAD